MVIDFITSKVLQPKVTLNLYQKLTKATNINNIEGAASSNLENVKLKNRVLSPIELITEFSKILDTLYNKKYIEDNYYKYLKEQCSSWKVLDNDLSLKVIK